MIYTKITANNIEDVFKSKRCSVDTMELKGYELIKEFFVDSSGWGCADEPAMLADRFVDELTKIVKEYNQVYTTITNAGQFQVYVGVFKRVGKSKCKRISTNVLEIKDGDTLTVRLYDTDIVKMTEDTITLDSGGFRTSTTKKWINQYITPAYDYVYQKNFEWFVRRGDNDHPFEDGMVLPL